MPLKLNFTETPRPSAQERRQRPGRKVIVEAIEEQIKLVEAQKSGESYTVNRQRYRKDPESGASTKISLSTKPRPWFFDHEGTYYGQIRYGNVPVDLSGKGLVTFSIGKTLDDVVKVFGQVKKAVETGEFDDPIASAKAKARRRGGRDAEASE